MHADQIVRLSEKLYRLLVNYNFETTNEKDFLKLISPEIIKWVYDAKVLELPDFIDQDTRIKIYHKINKELTTQLYKQNLCQ